MKYAIKLLKNSLHNFEYEIELIDKMVKEGKDDYPYDYQQLKDKRDGLRQALNKLGEEQ